MRILCICFAAFASAISIANGQTLMTLEDAIAAANSNNHQLKTAKAYASEKDYLALARKGLYMPKVGLSGSVARIPNDISLDLSPIKNTITPLYSTLGNYGNFSGLQHPDFGILPDAQSTQAVRTELIDGLAQIEATDWNTVLQKKNFGSLAINAQWTLYAGGKIRAANNIAKLQAEEGKEAYSQKKDEIFVNVIERYYALELAAHAENLRAEADNAMAKHLANAEKMYVEGLIAKQDLLRLRMAKSETKRELSKATSDKRLAATALKNLIDPDLDNDIITVSPLFVPDSVKDEEYYIDLALSNNGISRIIDLKEKQSLQNIKLERADLLPSVAAMVSYDIYSYNLSRLEPDWMVGIGMKWTLFEGGARSNKLNAAKQKNIQVREMAADAELGIATLAQKLYGELIAAIEQVYQLEDTEKFANEYVRAIEIAYENEFTGAAELADARLALARSGVAKYQAMYKANLALAQLLHLCSDTGSYYTYRR